MLLNKEQVNNEIKEEIKRQLETNENENAITQNPWDTVKAVSPKREMHSTIGLLQETNKQTNLK